MNNDDEEFDSKSSIDGLIQYSDDEEDTLLPFDSEDDFEEEELFSEIPPEEDIFENDVYTNFSYQKEKVRAPKKKNTRIPVIIGIIVIAVLITAFVKTDSGIIGTYKRNFANNFARIFRNFTPDRRYTYIEETPAPEVQYKSNIKDHIIVALEEASKTEFTAYKNGIVFANMNHLTYLDNTGSVVWETDTAIVDPILKANGNYILLAEKSGTKLCLYGDKKLLYDVDDPDKIISAELSSSGDAVIITDKSSYKGGISVYNKSGARIFSWASGGNTVISADISAASRCVAVATLNTENTADTTIRLFDVNKTDSYARINIGNTVVFDLKFTGDLLTSFGDNRINGISANGSLLYDNVFADKQLTHSAIDSKGNYILSLDDGNIPMINTYNKRGKLKSGITLTGVTDYIDINGRYILYNLGRDVYFGKINSKNTEKYTATMDIKKLIITSEKSFVIVYSNSIEVVTL